MKFKIRNSVGFKNVYVYYAWNGRNLDMQIGYDITKSNRYKYSPIFAKLDDAHMTVWLTPENAPPKSKFALLINLMGENTKETKRLSNCHAHIQECCSSDTYITLFPPISATQWNKGKDAKRLV